MAGGVLGEAFVKISPKFTSFGTEVASGVKSEMGAAEAEATAGGGKVKSGFLSPLKSMAGAAAGAFAAVKVGDFLKDGIQGALAAQQISQQTNAVIKSTGGAANVTSGQVDNLANSLKNKTSIDDDVIKSGENMLLTFTNIRNEAGKGNDIFNQTTKAMTDLSVATGEDMKSAAVQLGKALGDPTKGMTALQRVGVTFDDQQQKTIKSMQASGNIMGAQKIILGELNKEFGGSAQALGDSYQGKWNKLKNSMDDLGKSIGAALLPAISAFSDLLSKHVVPAIQSVVSWMTKHKEIIGPLAIALGTLAAIIGTVVAAVKVWTIVQGAFNAVMDANPIMLIVLAIGALVVGIIYAYNHFKTFRDVVQGVFGVVGDIFRGFLAVIKGVWNFIAHDLIPLLVKFGPVVLAAVMPMIGIPLLIIQHWGAIVDFFKGLPGEIAGFFKDAGTWLLDAGKAILTGLWTGITSVWTASVHFFTDLFHYVVDFFKDAPKWLLKAGKDILTGLWDGIKDVWKAELHFWTDLFHYVVNFFKQAPHWLLDAGKAILTGLWTGIKDVWKAELHFWTDIFHFIVNAFKTAGTWLLDAGKKIITGLWNGIKQIWHNEVHFFSDLPGNILHAIGDLSHLLFDAGKKVIQGLIDGIKSMFGALGSAASGAVGFIKDHLPFSPAKVGPLSGKGAPINSGMSIGRQIADGIASQRDRIAASMADVTALVQGTVIAPQVGNLQVPALAGVGALGTTVHHQETKKTHVEVHTLTLQVQGAFNLTNPVEQRRAAEQIRQMLVGLERETK